MDRHLNTPTVLRRLSLPLLVASVLVLGVMRVFWINAHAVNVLYMDQWDFYRTLFNGEGWWASFLTQHGPHRQGIGMWLARLLCNLSSWDNRWEAFASFGVLVAGAAAALPLARRFGLPPSSLALLALPLLFLNAHQYEVWVAAVNLSHGVVPVLLITLSCLVWFLRNPWWRIASLSLLSFLLTFTGFGLFMGVVTPFLVVLEGLQLARSKGVRSALPHAAGVVASAFSWWLFLHDYRFDPGAPGFHFPHERPWEYLEFMARMFGNAYGFHDHNPLQVVSGSVLLGLLIAIFVVQGRRLWRTGAEANPHAAVLVSLAGFTLLYCAQCAIGRVFGGTYGALAPRYVTLLIPGGLALFLQAVSASRTPFGKAVLVLFVAGLVPMTAWLRPNEQEGAAWYRNGKETWRRVYLETRSQAKADAAAQFQVYPSDITPRLRYLEERQLNLFHHPKEVR